MINIIEVAEKIKQLREDEYERIVHIVERIKVHKDNEILSHRYRNVLVKELTKLRIIA